MDLKRSAVRKEGGTPHLGSAHTDAEVELLRAVGAQRIAAGQDQLPLDVAAPREPAALEITSSRMGRLLAAIAAVYRQLGFDLACGGDVVFEQLVTARIIEPTSKQDAARVLAEAGVRALSYRTVKRRLPSYAKYEWRDRLSGACAAAAQLGPSALILYDVTTLWFETDTGDGFREPGFSKERRLDPQITVGLLTDVTGMPLMIDAFEGNRAETKTIIPLVQRFVAAHGIAGVTVIADAGMMSEANLADLEDAGWSFVIGGKLPEVPYAIKQWRQEDPDREPADGTTLTQPVIMGPKADQRRRTTLYQYKAERARRTLHGIDQQVAKAEKAVAGQAPIKRNRFVTLTGGTRSVNRDLETKTRALAGWKPYVTNLDTEPAWVIGAYHQLWRIEHAFRMSKHDLRARPVYHHKRESIDAHLAVVFAALAISHRIEAQTGWTIKKFVRSLRRYRTVKINTGSHILTAEHPLPEDVHHALAAIHQARTNLAQVGS
jgi:Transposase DDE domain